MACLTADVSKAKGGFVEVWQVVDRCRSFCNGAVCIVCHPWVPAAMHTRCGSGARDGMAMQPKSLAFTDPGVAIYTSAIQKAVSKGCRMEHHGCCTHTHTHMWFDRECLTEKQICFKSLMHNNPCDKQCSGMLLA